MASFGAVLGGIGAVSRLAQFLTGSGPLQLGDLEFPNFSTPERVNHGGSQHVAVHKLPGGARVVDLLGRDDRDITWSGLFFGPNAEQQAQQLDQLRIDGNRLPLTWGENALDVIVTQVDREQAYHQVRYQVTCLVIADDGGGEDSTPLADLVGEDVASAITEAPAAIQGALSTASQVVSVAAGFGIGSTALANTLATLDGVGQQISGTISTTGAALTSLEGITGPLASAGSVSDALQSAGDHAGSVLAQGYIGRAIANVTAGQS